MNLIFFLQPKANKTCDNFLLIFWKGRSIILAYWERGKIIIRKHCFFDVSEHGENISRNSVITGEGGKCVPEDSKAFKKKWLN